MKSRHISSIKTKIFVSYGSIILILILLASGLYYFTAYNAFMENYTKSSHQLSKIVSNQLDQHFDKINAVQKKILESDLIRDYIFENAAKHDFYYDREFQKMIFAITGYDYDFYHMNILNMEDETLIAFGNRYQYMPYPITADIRQKIIDKTIALNGAKLVIPTNQGTFYEVNESEPTLSLTRSFPRYSDSLSEPKGIIEMQISYKTIEKLLSDSLFSYNSHAESVLIFNEKKELIYPIPMEPDLFSFYTNADTLGHTVFKNPISKEKELITAYSSSKTGLTCLLITPYTSLSGNIRFFRIICFFIAVTSLVLLITISYRVAKSISSPIIALKDSISNLQLTSITEKSVYAPESSLNELELLNNAYNHMQIRLKKSLDDIVKQRTLSIHSQIMALQAQMDSHFLYNTLTIISIIAEENDDPQASGMCVKLTQMLRYITEDYSKSTTFANELEHTKNYTDLMSIRFADNIAFTYEIDFNLNTLLIPRLIIQPLVENCVKYARSDDKVLSISIHTYSDKHYWYTQITDNGSGFTAQSLQSIYNKIDRLNSEQDYPQITMNGMGLANIYLRLKLFYDEKFMFHIENETIGASIMIGGMINE